MNIQISGITSRDSLPLPPLVSLGSNNLIGLGFGMSGAIMSSLFFSWAAFIQHELLQEGQYQLLSCQ